MSTHALPELSAVAWRPVVDAAALRRRGRLWTLTTVSHTVPFLCAAMLLLALVPVMLPIAIVLVIHAWVIPELYAARGANVVRRRPVSASGPERRALGLLGDLLDHPARALHERTGLVLERGRLGVWLVAEAGAVLVAPGGHRVHCYCVRVADPELPAGDRVAHLLLALRTDETGFATVANLAFSGAPWRLRRRIPPPLREALAAGVARA